jgi:PPOX class probable F420-dependent enzyme
VALAYHRVMPDSAPAAAVPATFSTDGLRFIRTPGLYATIATIGRDGAPHQARIWYRLEGETVVINSAVGRRWPTDLLRDPRISLTVAEGYDWVGLDGIVEPIEDQATAQADIATMARAYETREEAAASIARFRGERRISFLVHPHRIHEEFEE